MVIVSARAPRSLARGRVAAVVAGFLDQGFGLGEMLAGLDAVAVAEGEAGGGEVVVGEVESHAGARGDAEDFVEVLGRAAGEEGERQIVDCPGAARRKSTAWSRW